VDLPLDFTGVFRTNLHASESDDPFSQIADPFPRPRGKYDVILIFVQENGKHEFWAGSRCTTAVVLQNLAFSLRQLESFAYSQNITSESLFVQYRYRDLRSSASS